MSILPLLNSTVTVRRKTEAQGATTGGNVATWANQTTGVPCMIQPASSREALYLQRETGIATYDVYFDFGADVLVTDELLVSTGSGDALNGIYLDVVSVPVDDAGRQEYTRVVVQRTTGEDT